VGADETQIAAVGDCLIQHPIPVAERAEMRAVRDFVSSADLAMANLEGVLQERMSWPAYVAGQGGFGSPYLSVDMDTMRSLRDVGFDLFFTANNHASDFGEEGILETVRCLDRLGLRHAGSGASLREATTATMMTSRSGRRASVVGASDCGIRSRGEVPFPVPRGCFASDEPGPFPSRPGCNMIRYEPTFFVDEEVLTSLRRASELLGWDAEKELRRRGGGIHSPSAGTSLLDKRLDTDEVCYFNGTRFQAADEFGFTTVAAPEDLERNARAVQEARAVSDIVIAAIHQQGSSPNDDESPHHVEAYADAVIAAGADVVLAHGHGRVGGIEIRDGAVFLHGMPQFVFHLLQRTIAPEEQMLRCGLAPGSSASRLMEFVAESIGTGLYPSQFGASAPKSASAIFSLIFGPDDRVSRVEIRPVTIGWSSSSGWPAFIPWPSEDHERVLAEVAQRSSVYGTTLDVEDGVGIVRVGDR
jgi:poly-gamma-glutamate capsule biosynthesis protein CapA/YwtB (metallophosphatase superfamily)